MEKEKNYRIAKRVYYGCRVMLVLSIVLLLWVGYDYLVNKVYTHRIEIAIINIALFTTLMRRNKKIKDEYESGE